MSAPDNGGPAFPIFIVAGDVDPRQVADACRNSAGLTLRDYFAANATKEDLDGYVSILREKSAIGMLRDNWTAIARYMHADAMLEARK